MDLTRKKIFILFLQVLLLLHKEAVVYYMTDYFNNKL